MKSFTLYWLTVSIASAADLVAPPPSSFALSGPVVGLIALLAIAVVGYFVVWPKIKKKQEAAPIARVDPTLTDKPPAITLPPTTTTTPSPAAVAPVISANGVGGFPLPASGEGMQAYMQRAGISVGTYQWQMQAEAAQHPGHGWDEIADRVMHPEHFYTQADLDTIAAAQRAPVGVQITDVSGTSISLPGPGRYRTTLGGATTFSFHLDKPGRFSAVDCDGQPVPMTASASNGGATNGNSITLSVDAGDFTVTLSPLGNPGRIFVDLNMS